MNHGKLLVEIATTQDMIRRARTSLEAEAVGWKREGLEELIADGSEALADLEATERAHMKAELAKLKN